MIESLERRVLLSATVEEHLTEALVSSFRGPGQFLAANPMAGVEASASARTQDADEPFAGHTYTLTSDTPMTIYNDKLQQVNIGTKVILQFGPVHDVVSANNPYNLMKPDGTVLQSGTWSETGPISNMWTLSLWPDTKGIYGFALISEILFTYDNPSTGTFYANGALSAGGDFLSLPTGTDVSKIVPAPSAWHWSLKSPTGFNVQISYHDQLGIDDDSVHASAVTVTAPDGTALPVSFANGSASSDGLTYTANYTVTAPGGSLDFADNGTYTVGVQGYAIYNSVGHPNTATAIGAFTVAQPVPDPVVNGSATARSIIAGTGPGAPARLRVLDGDGHVMQDYYPFDEFTGGMTVASGDVNRDGTPDIIVAAGPGGASNIRVLDGNTAEPISGPLGSFLAYPGAGGDPAVTSSPFYTAAFQGQINLASGDINGDGHDDIIVSVAADGPPHLKVFSGADGSELMSMLVYPGASDPADPAYFSNAFRGGVRVASGDVTGDGRDDIITGAGPGAGPHVKVFDGVTQQAVKSYFAYAPGYGGGVRVASADYNGDGVDDLITAPGIGAGPNVKVIDAPTGAELASFWAYDPGYVGGVWLASGDINGDGRADILTTPAAGAASNVKVFAGGSAYAPSTISSFFAFAPSYVGGGRIAVPTG